MNTPAPNLEDFAIYPMSGYQVYTFSDKWQIHTSHHKAWIPRTELSSVPDIPIMVMLMYDWVNWLEWIVFIPAVSRDGIALTHCQASWQLE